MKKNWINKQLTKILTVITAFLLILNIFYLFKDDLFKANTNFVEEAIHTNSIEPAKINTLIFDKIPLKLKSIKLLKGNSNKEFIGYNIKPQKNRFLPVSPFQSQFVSNLMEKKDLNTNLYSNEYKERYEEWSSLYESIDHVPKHIKEEYPNGFTREIKNPYSKRFKPASDLLLKRCKPVDGFDMPCGAPNGEGYYLAQIFGNSDHHMGEDWNGVGGGNSDLGDPVYAIADGAVYWSKINKGSWGNLVRLIHNVGTRNHPVYIESFYAHLDTVLVWEGQEVVRGQQIGTIGDAHGHFQAHLHLEIRKNINTPLGKAYTTDTVGFGYVEPLPYIETRRPSNYRPTIARKNRNFRSSSNY